MAVFRLLPVLLLCSLALAEKVEITSTPSGATIEINDVKTGTTPYTMKVPGGYFHKTRSLITSRLEHQMHIRVILPAYVTKELDMATGPYPWLGMLGESHGDYWLLKAKQFHFDLTPVSAAAPDNGASPSSGSAIEPPPALKQMDEIAGGTTPTPAAASSGGKVNITSTPANADIYVDDKFVGNAPATLTLTPGPHHIMVKMENYADWERTLEVVKDSDVSLSATLKAKATNANQK